MAEAVTDGRAAEPVTIDGRDIIVAYGSETGNAEDIAMELADMTRRLHFRTVVDELDNIKLWDFKALTIGHIRAQTELIQCRLAIFVTSTTGQGDLPRNTERFWKNIRRTRLNNTNCLGPLKFTIFGLGDSSYPRVNAAARKLRSRLLQLGASEFFEAGEGDERHDNGIDSVYQPWSKELKDHLITNYPLPAHIQPLSDDIQLPPRYYINVLPEEPMTSNNLTGAMALESASDEAERKFLATKTQPAAVTHVERPMSSKERMASDSSRFSLAIAARANSVWEAQNPRLVGSLDKDNVLADYPSKYLLKEPAPYDAGTQELPPADLVAIPNTLLATVDDNVRVTPNSHWQDVRHLTITVQMDERSDIPFLPYTAGATLVIYPKNYPDDVDTLIDMMGWRFIADAIIDLRSSSLQKKLYPMEVGKPTFRGMLTHNFDITAVPKRSFLKAISSFTEDRNEKERLISLTQTSFQEEFYDYTSRPRRTILEVLRDFPGVKIPFKRALEVFPLIRGREFSICSGSQQIEDDGSDLVKLEILVALVEYKTLIRKPRQGLCSRYIKYLQPDTAIRVGINPPSSPSLNPKSLVVGPTAAQQGRPVIAVATGTGIAPIRALVGDRLGAKIRSPLLLFFGCRNKTADFFFSNEWNTKWMAESANFKVIPAFSRDKNPREVEPIVEKDIYGRVKTKDVDPLDAPIRILDFDSGKHYVQHQIRKHAVEVARLLAGEVKPIICVCGNSGRMPDAVRDAFEDVLVDQGVVPGKDEAILWLRNERNVTYWQETW